jgi:biotin synthase-like enzyme
MIQQSCREEIEALLKDPKYWTINRRAFKADHPDICENTLDNCWNHLRYEERIMIDITPKKYRREYKTRCLHCNRKITLKQAIAPDRLSIKTHCVYCYSVGQMAQVTPKYLPNHAARVMQF